MAVGAAATLYHATSGSARRLARKIDYWTIAYSSSALVKSVYADRCACGASCWVQRGGCRRAECWRDCWVGGRRLKHDFPWQRDPPAPPRPMPTHPLPAAPTCCSPGMRRAASLSLLAVPFRPFAVSCANALLMQAEFVRQAVKHKVGRRWWQCGWQWWMVVGNWPLS